MSVNKTVENVYLRHDAVKLTRKHFWRLLGMTLVVSLVATGLEYLLVWLGELLIAPIGVASAESLLAEAPTAASSAIFYVVNLVFALVSALFASGLNLGYNAQLIDAGRGGVPRVFGVFKRMRYCLKGWGLELLIGLKVFWWMLPGLVTVIVGAELEIYGYSAIANWVIIAGIGLLFGLAIPAALRYSLAPYIMADEPDRGIRECVTLSKGLMKDRKWQYFKLGVPMILKMIGLMYAIIFAGALIISLIGLIEHLYLLDILVYLALLPCVYFGLQMNMVYVLFYLKRREPAADEPVSYWLRKEEPQSAQPVSAWLEATPASAPAPADEAAPEAAESAEASESIEAPAESCEDSPEDISPETNEEEENNHE